MFVLLGRVRVPPLLGCPPRNGAGNSMKFPKFLSPTRLAIYMERGREGAKTAPGRFWRSKKRMLFTSGAQQVKLTPARSGLSVLPPRGTLPALEVEASPASLMLTLGACQPVRCAVSTLPHLNAGTTSA